MIELREDEEQFRHNVEGSGLDWIRMRWREGAHVEESV